MIKHECFLKSKDPEHETGRADLVIINPSGLCSNSASTEEPLGLVWESIYSNNSPNWVARALK